MSLAKPDSRKCILKSKVVSGTEIGVWMSLCVCVCQQAADMKSTTI